MVPKDGGYLSGTEAWKPERRTTGTKIFLSGMSYPAQMKLKYFVIHSPIESSIPAELCGVLMAGF